MDNMIGSNIDICQEFFAIPLEESWKKYTNFWFKGELLQCNSLPMGVSPAPYIGQKCIQATVSDDNFSAFLQHKGWRKKFSSDAL